MQIDWNLLGRPVDIGARFQEGMEFGRQQRRQRATEEAMQSFAVNPNDPSARNALMMADPRLGMQMRNQDMQLQRQQQTDTMAAQEAAREQQQQRAKVIANAAKMAKDPQSWDAIAQNLAANGIPEAAQYVGKFSPEIRASAMAMGGLTDDDEPNSPASVQEYEYAKQGGFAGSYMEFIDTKRGPMIANNGDGTFTIIPRTQGAPQAQGAPPPPPGFVLDSDGGQTAPPSGTFRP